VCGRVRVRVCACACVRVSLYVRTHVCMYTKARVNWVEMLIYRLEVIWTVMILRIIEKSD
jgi:hypothetical protein